jgi:hypothetical protein
MPGCGQPSDPSEKVSSVAETTGDFGDDRVEDRGRQVDLTG